MGHYPPPGGVKATVKQNLPAFNSTLEMEGTAWVVQTRNEFLCHDWVATLDGRQRIGPACPIRGKPSAGRAAKAQSSHAQGQTPHVPLHVEGLGREECKDIAKRLHRAVWRSSQSNTDEQL